MLKPSSETLNLGISSPRQKSGAQNSGQGITQSNALTIVFLASELKEEMQVKDIQADIHNGAWTLYKNTKLLTLAEINKKFHPEIGSIIFCLI